MKEDVYKRNMVSCVISVLPSRACRISVLLQQIFKLVDFLVLGTLKKQVGNIYFSTILYNPLVRLAAVAKSMQLLQSHKSYPFK
jgi:hypothetical protein